MNKTEMIKALCERNVWQKGTAEMAVEGVIELIKDTLAKGGEVNLHGFGTFAVTAKPERQGRNPKTGEPLTIAASKAPKFKAAKAFKDAVNG